MANSAVGGSSAAAHEGSASIGWLVPSEGGSAAQCKKGIWSIALAAAVASATGCHILIKRAIWVSEAAISAFKSSHQRSEEAIARFAENPVSVEMGTSPILSSTVMSRSDEACAMRLSAWISQHGFDRRHADQRAEARVRARMHKWHDMPANSRT